VSENIYRLDLTERERGDALDALDAWMNQNCDAHEVWRRVWELYRKIDALEPIGTGGTTEGNG